MEVNRNQFFLLGILILLLGLQLRSVESYVLNEKASRFLAERFHSSLATNDGGVQALLGPVGATPRRTIRPPEWLGWFLMSVGSVLMLHSLAMKRPGS